MTPAVPGSISQGLLQRWSLAGIQRVAAQGSHSEEDTESQGPSGTGLLGSQGGEHPRAPRLGARLW